MIVLAVWIVCNRHRPHRAAVQEVIIIFIERWKLRNLVGPCIGDVGAKRIRPIDLVELAILFGPNSHGER